MVSPDYGITVKKENDVYMNGKRVTRVVEELTDIKIGAAPDTQLFSIPRNYKEVATPQNCPTCVK